MRNLLPGLPLAALFSGRKKWFSIAVVLVMAASVTNFGYFVWSPGGKGDTVKIVDLAKGTTIRKFADELAAQKVIRSTFMFQLLARLNGASAKAKAGTYQLSDAMTPAEILRKLVSGEIYEKKFSLPEGYSIYQAAELLDAKKLFSGEDFLRACRDRQLLQQLGINGATAEGYLYPGTYNLLKMADPADLVKTMAAQATKLYAERFAPLGKGVRLSRHQVLTLASIVEKEAVAPQERPVIASVFFNRLKKKMPLQSDPTAVYGVRAFSGRVSGEDVRRNSAYNTYVINGLPPGPIGNPSEGAIEAVLKPAVTGYYYFVAKKDGSHHFSATLAEHNRAVNLYLKGKSTQ
jgi:UPF0755 protein